MAPLIVLAVLVGVPILEITVIIQVGHLIGALPAVTLLLATSLAGGSLLRRQGTRAWQAFTEALAERRPPHPETVDGALVLTGGILMLVPGFVTDAVGLLCLLPPTRTLARRLLLAAARRRTDTVTVLRVRSHRDPAHPGDQPPHHRVIDGETEPAPRDTHR